MKLVRVLVTLKLVTSILYQKKGWEVDLDSIEALADENTVAMVIINPSNPCGNVLMSQHLKKVVVYLYNLNFDGSDSFLFNKKFQLFSFLLT